MPVKRSTSLNFTTQQNCSSSFHYTGETGKETQRERVMILQQFDMGHYESAKMGITRQF